MAGAAETLRYALIVLTNISACYFLMWLVLGKRRSAKALAIYYLIRVILVNVIMNQMYGKYIAVHPTLRCLYIIVTGIAILGNYGMLLYTFQGGCIKVLLTSNIAEITVTAVSVAIMVLVNNLRGDLDAFEFSGRLQWEDILIPFGMFTVCILINFVAGDRLKRIRNYELRHKKLWAVVSVVWISAAFISLLPEYNYTISITVYIIAFGCIVYCVVSVLLVIRLLQSWRRQVFQKHNYLTKQKELMHLHSEAVRRQISLMEQQQAEIDEQMESLSEIEDLSEKNRTAFEYLEKLKAQYGAIKAGVYSDDHMLDSVLYGYAGIFEKYGVTPEFSFGTYRRGCLKEEDVPEVLLDLLETALSEIRRADPEKRFLRLQGGTVKNQVFFQMECANGSRRLRRISKVRTFAEIGMVRHHLKRLGGQLTVSRNKDCVKVKVLLAGR